jgi:hypothetical protein
MPHCHVRSKRWDELIGLDLVEHRYDDDFDFVEEQDRAEMKTEFMAFLEDGGICEATEKPVLKKQLSTTWLDQGLNRQFSNGLSNASPVSRSNTDPHSQSTQSNYLRRHLSKMKKVDGAGFAKVLRELADILEEPELEDSSEKSQLQRKATQFKKGTAGAETSLDI